MAFFFFPSGSLSRVRFFFFFQAEDGIRDSSVTGVQTCALPIWTATRRGDRLELAAEDDRGARVAIEAWPVAADIIRLHMGVGAARPSRLLIPEEIGRASCRERV